MLESIVALGRRVLRLGAAHTCSQCDGNVSTYKQHMWSVLSALEEPRMALAANISVKHFMFSQVIVAFQCIVSIVVEEHVVINVR